MKCFIASAFDYEDVDAIYDNSILPILKELGIKPQRVDRIEHNDDIDDKIFQLIGNSDLLIADLTYSRPSVYYEAGYAYGYGKPVIYIARNDHFKAKEKDHHGNFRVHFDLQMKNIIPWTRPNVTFNNRLRKRINHVIKPIIKNQKLQNIAVEKEKEFKSLSLNDQFNALIKKGKNLLHARDFTKGRFPGTHFMHREPHHYHLQRIKDKTYQQVHLVNRASVTITAFKDFWHYLLFFNSMEEEESVTKYETLILITSIKSVRQSTISTTLATYTPISEYLYCQESKERPEKVYVAIIGNVKSVDQFADNLKQVCQKINFG